MQLRSLLRSNRFVGCQNPREFIPPFCKAPEKVLTIFVVETEGKICLQFKDKQGTAEAYSLPLPNHVHERIEFWNRWAQYAMEHEYEYTPSLYGLEAYAVSIAMDVSRALPEHSVNYCGLPVHDEFAICIHLRSDRLSAYNADFRKNPCALPPDIIPNQYLKRLLAEQENALTTPPKHGFRGWGDFDYTYGELHFAPACEPYTWIGGEDSFRPDTQDGFPQWLCDKVEEWEESLLDCYYDNVRWCPAPTLLHMDEDALAVDVARYHSPLVPIAMSDRFYAGDDVLHLAEVDGTFHRQNPL